MPSLVLPVSLLEVLWAAMTSLGAHMTPEPESALEDLMGRYLGGDSRAFDELFRRVSPRLYGYLIRLTRRPDRAEDLVQITFAKIHRAREGYIRGAPVMPWVLAIGRRAFLDEVRRTKSRPEDLSTDGLVPEPAPEPQGLSNDLADALESALTRLPVQYAEAIQLLKVTGLSVRDAAEVLGASESAVKLRAHRGYVLLRKELEAFSRLPAEGPS